MLILHLSDIHFRKPGCLDPEMDQDQPVRTLLIKDAEKLCENLGRRVDIIIVSGDIAYQADREEFEVAAEWLIEVAREVGCSLENVYTVPGNHDIDRTCLNDDGVQAFRKSIQDVAIESRATKFLEIFRNKDYGPILMRPFEAYNMFAARYGCDIYPPKRPFWIANIELGSEVILRLRGLSTPIFSGSEDEKRKLYLGSFQTVFDPEENVVHLTIQHHPPDWLEDCDEVEDALENGAKIQLMGHKHRNRITQTDEYVRFSAGAVNPNRLEREWEPGYNLIEVKVVGESSEKKIEINSRIRKWQSSPNQFVAKLNSEQSEVFSKIFSVSSENRACVPDLCSESSVQNFQTTVPEENEMMPQESNKNLIFRFWNLANSKQRQIVNQLHLLKEDEFKLPEFERYRRAFQSAKEAGLIDELAQAIEVAEKNKEQ